MDYAIYPQTTPALELHNSQSIDGYNNTLNISYNLIISSHPKNNNNNSRLPSSSGIYQSIALPFSITCW